MPWKYGPYEGGHEAEAVGIYAGGGMQEGGCHGSRGRIKAVMERRPSEYM